MTPDQLALFLPAAVLLALAPGPDNLAVLALAVARGPRPALGFALGCAAGCLNHTLLAALGISAALAASPLLFRVLQWGGAAYLVWLGVQALRSRRLGQGGAPDGAEGFGSAFRKGLLANAVNPKVAVFFLAFLPQFVRAGGWPAGMQIAGFGVLFASVAALVFCAVALAGSRCGAWVRRHPGAALWLDRAVGMLFIALGAWMVWPRS